MRKLFNVLSDYHPQGVVPPAPSDTPPPNPFPAPIFPFMNGMLGSDLNFFPITVWLQNPQFTAASYKAIGINVFNSLFNTPTAADLDAIRAAGLKIILSQQSTALGPLASYADVYAGWQGYDEPDNSLAPDGTQNSLPSTTVINTYTAYKTADPVRPVAINFGEAVGDPSLPDRGLSTGQNSGSGLYTYTSYSNGADILSFDIYPRNNGYPLTVVADGVDNLKSWCGTDKPIWAYIECTKILNTGNKPTPAQVKAEVWLALTHGASGIQYFPTQFQPTEVDDALLHDGTMSAAVAAINTQIKNLAPVLNSPTVAIASVACSSRIDYAVKQYAGSTYLFAVHPNSGSATATFTVSGFSNRTVTVIDENRTLTMTGGVFTDTFAGEAVHLYNF